MFERTASVFKASNFFESWIFKCILLFTLVPYIFVHICLIVSVRVFVSVQVYMYDSVCGRFAINFHKAMHTIGTP